MINEIFNNIIKIALSMGLLALAYYLWRCAVNSKYLFYLDIIQEITEINNIRDHESTYELIVEDVKDQIPNEIIRYMKRKGVRLDLLIISFLEKDWQISEI